MYTATYTQSDERSLTAVAYDVLKQRLLFGEFALGRRLAEVALAERLGVSRTPVREALARLHAEGFIVRLPEGGFAPAAPDLHTIEELYVVRRGLELTALHIDTGHDLVALEALREDWISIEPPADGDGDPNFVLHDEDFHIRLAGAAGNQALVEMLTRVSERIRIVRIHDFLTADRIGQTIEEHLSIVDAVLAGNRPLAESRLERLVQISRDVVRHRSAIALSRMLRGGGDG